MFVVFDGACCYVAEKYNSDPYTKWDERRTIMKTKKLIQKTFLTLALGVVPCLLYANTPNDKFGAACTNKEKLKDCEIFHLINKKSTSTNELTKFISLNPGSVLALKEVEDNDRYYFGERKKAEIPVAWALRAHREDLFDTLYLATKKLNPDVNLSNKLFTNIERNIDGNSFSYTNYESLYSYAVRYGSLKLIKSMDQQGAGNLEHLCDDYAGLMDEPNGLEVSRCVHEKFYLALKTNTVDVISYILKSHSKIDINFAEYMQETPLQIAINRNYFELAKSLVKNGASVDDDYRLLYEVKDEKIAQLLIDSGANPNPIVNAGDFSPLAMAARYNRIKVMEVLIKSGADIYGRGYRKDYQNNTYIKIGHSVMQYAIAYSFDAVKTLINAGFDVNDKDEKALFYAVTNLINDKDNLNIVKLLLKSGADVNAITTVSFSSKVDDSQVGVLHNAAAVCIPGMIDLLLSHGAKKNTLTYIIPFDDYNSNGIYPFEWAKKANEKFGTEACVNALKIADARGPSKPNPTDTHPCTDTAEVRCPIYLKNIFYGFGYPINELPILMLNEKGDMLD
jgi:ankyrin repeat protein